MEPQALALQQWLCDQTRKTIRLIVTDNRSLFLSLKARPDGTISVRAHRIFLDAPSPVRSALADWVNGRRGSTRRIIRRFVDEHAARPQLDLPLFAGKLRRLRLRAQGRIHDLGAMRDAINRDYFGGKLTCAITWGRRLRARARRHFTFGTYSHTQNVVRIHPRLDAEDVPRFFVEFIVYHEMLHAARGQEGERNGRRILHSKEFRADERKFARYDEAIAWEKKNLSRLLASRRMWEVEGQRGSNQERSLKGIIPVGVR